MAKLIEDIQELQNYESLHTNSSSLPPISTSNQYTCEEVIEQIGFGKFQIRILLVLGFAWIVDSSEILILSIVPLYLQCEWNIDKIQIAWITTSVFLGMTISSPIIGWMCDKYGRKRSILLAMLFGVAMSILSSFSPNYQWFILLRFLVGISLGGMTQVVGYATEFLPRSQRRYTLLGQLFWPVGGVISALVGMTTLYGLTWRWYILVMCIPPIIGIVLLFQMPESCMFLLTAGKREEAKETLNQIARVNSKELPVGDLVLKAGCIYSSINKVDNKVVRRGNVLKLFSRKHWKTTILVSFLQFTIGLCYYGAVLLTTNYFTAAEKICSTNKADAHRLNSKSFTTCLYCQQLTLRDYLDLAWTACAEAPGDLLTFYLFELVGRKPTLFIQFTTAFISIFVLLFCSSWYVHIVFLFIARGISQGAAVGIQQYTPEVYPTSLRGIGTGVGNLWFRCGAMLSPFMAQVAIYKSLQGTVLFYLAFLFLSMIASLLLPIETKGRSLEQTEEE